MALTRITEGVIKPNENYVVNNINSSGVTTSTNFKTGTSNLHNVGIEIAGINVLGADTPIGTGATIYDAGGALFTGVVTATSFSGSGNIGGVDGNFSGNVTGVDATFSGNVSVGGTLTYEDVTNIDSVGLITARGGITLSGGNISLADRPDGNSHNLFFGTGARAAAYHDGTNFTVINNTGHTYIGVGAANKDLMLYAQSTGNIILQRNTGHKYFEGVGSDGTAKIYHNTNEKIRTTNTGAVVTGILTATSFKGDGSALTGLNSDKIIEGNSYAEVLDTGTNGIFRFLPEGIEKFRITTDGKVGIGTFTPGQKLDVRDGDLILSSSNAGNAHRTSFIEFTGSYARINSVMGQGSTSNSNYAAGWNFTTRNYTGSAFETLTPFTIQANGKIGINNTSPDYKLDVNGSGRFADNLVINTTKRIQTNSSTGQLTIQGGATYPGGAIKFAGGQSGATDRGTILFYAGETSSLQEKVRITSNGRLNIGTGQLDQTDRMLNVYGGRARISGIPANSNSFEVYANSTTGQSHGILIDAGTNSSDINSHFRQKGGATLLKIRGDGNIGVGADTPARKVHVKNAGIIKLENTSTGGWLGLEFLGSSGTNNYDAYMGVLDSNGLFFIDNNSNGNDICINRIGKVFIGADATDFSDAGSFLNIKNDTYGGRIAFSNNTATAGVALMEQFAYWGSNKVAGTIISAGTDTTNKDDANMKFYTASAGVVKERIQIKSDSAILHTRDDNVGRHDVEFRNTGGIGSGNFGGIKWTQGSTGGTFLGGITIGYHDTGRPDMVFYRRDGGGTGSAETLRLDRDGKIRTHGATDTGHNGMIYIQGLSDPVADETHSNLTVRGEGGNGFACGTYEGTANYGSWIQAGYVPNFTGGSPAATYPLILNPNGNCVCVGNYNDASTTDAGLLRVQSRHGTNFYNDCTLSLEHYNQSNAREQKWHFISASNQGTEAKSNSKFRQMAVPYTSDSTFQTHTDQIVYAHTVGFNEYSWYKFNTRASSSPDRGGSARIAITWSTRHAAGTGYGEYSFAWTDAHNTSRVECFLRKQHFLSFQGGSYYGWSSNPEVVVYYCTGGGSAAGFYLRLRGHGNHNSSTYDMGTIHNFHIIHNDNNAGGNNSYFEFVTNNSGGPSDASSVLSFN